MSKRIIQEDENTKHLTNMVDLLQQILQSSNDSNEGLSKLGQLLKDLDVSVDYLSSAVTDRSTLGIDLDQSAFGRLAKPSKKAEKTLNETKPNKMSKEFKRWAKLANLPKKPKKQQLDENIGGIVGIPAISQITYTPTIYETAFDHFLSEKYENMEDEDTKPTLKDGVVPENHTLKAYALAEKLIKDMDIPEEFRGHEDKFLALIKALDDKLYEKAADMFAMRAGAAPDEIHSIGSPEEDEYARNVDYSDESQPHVGYE